MKRFTLINVLFALFTAHAGYAACGDGVLDPGEECDVANSPDLCPLEDVWSGACRFCDQACTFSTEALVAPEVSAIGSKVAPPKASPWGAPVGPPTDAFYFQMPSTGEVDISTIVEGCQGDSTLELLRIRDAWGNAVSGPSFFNDDQGGTLCSRINQSLPAGRYALKVRGYNNTAIDYELRMQRWLDGAQPSTIASGFPAFGSQLIKFNHNGGPLEIVTAAGAGSDACAPGLDTVMQLQYSDGTPVVPEDDDGGDGYCSRISVSNVPGIPLQVLVHGYGQQAAEDFVVHIR